VGRGTLRYQLLVLERSTLKYLMLLTVSTAVLQCKVGGQVSPFHPEVQNHLIITIVRIISVSGSVSINKDIEMFWFMVR
jgi:hypothetical protein